MVKGKKFLIVLFISAVFLFLFAIHFFDYPGVEGADSAVVFAAGDIASCYSIGDEKTSALLDRFEGPIFTLGDNVYPDGKLEEFRDCFEPSWGRHKSRIYPAAGNHEYNTPAASGYFSFFGERAGDPAKGYYSFDIAKWHIIVLNSNCLQVGGCGVGSVQHLWLEDDLKNNSSLCTLAFMHHPRFSSEGNNGFLQPVWETLNSGKVDLVLAGHEHAYERLATLDSFGNKNENGLRLIIAGTGGAALRNIDVPAALSEAKNDSVWGILKLELNPDTYKWEFVAVDGENYADTGVGKCR